MTPKIYWRPRSVSLPVLFLIAVFSIIGFYLVQIFPMRVNTEYYKEQMKAAHLALTAMEAVRAEKIKQDPHFENAVDPAHSGLLGSSMTPITSEVGSLIAKRTSVNANFAAVLILLLRNAGVKDGDAVAVGISSSFPALNICLYAAMSTMHLKPIIISSSSASQWGANNPDLTWIDMERILYQKDIFPFRSVLATLGSKGDIGKGLSPEGRDLLVKAVERNGLPLFEPENLQEDIRRRMEIYQHSGVPIAAYINIGGGTASTGINIGKEWFKTGINKKLPRAVRKNPSVMRRFLEQGIPVINMRNVRVLARRYGLPVDPTVIPAVGEGKIYYYYRSNPMLAGGILAAIILCLYIVIRSEWGFRIFGRSSTGTDNSPTPMV